MTGTSFVLNLTLVPRLKPDDNWPAPSPPMPPTGYSPVWVLLGLLLLALIIAYFLVTALLTRRQTRAVRQHPDAQPADPVTLQSQLAERVHALEQRARNGELGQREATEELSRAVRNYVAAITGIPADKMTLRQLQQSPLRGTADAVAKFYPAVFAAEPPENFDESVRAARQVMSGCH